MVVSHVFPGTKFFARPPKEKTRMSDPILLTDAEMDLVAGGFTVGNVSVTPVGHLNTQSNGFGLGHQ